MADRGEFDAPAKSAWNFEAYDSSLERKYMEQLEADPAVRKWTKRHGISIRWLDDRKHRHTYRPDFLVEYADGSLELVETKGAHMVQNPDVQARSRAAEHWCSLRGMTYRMLTIE